MHTAKKEGKCEGATETEYEMVQTNANTNKKFQSHPLGGRMAYRVAVARGRRAASSAALMDSVPLLEPWEEVLWAELLVGAASRAMVLNPGTGLSK
jgi:hypothetical protein